MAAFVVGACRSVALWTWLLTFFVHLLCLDFTTADKVEWYTAFVNITYLDPVTSEVRTDKTECGRYGQHSPKKEARGLVVVPSIPQDRQVCEPDVRFSSVQHGTAWVALVAAGNCTYREKIRNAAGRNASAVVIYNVGSSSTNDTITMPHPGTGEVVAVMIPEQKGHEIVSLLERNITVMMHITIGTRNLQKYVSRTSVVFVSISFIVLMIISLAWLIFYYIQRFRYANARDRNQRRLGDTVKKAISKLQLRTIKKGDKETGSEFDNCAVCIEGYKPNDIVRILPCKHIFHKQCVDPWLQDHRTCPMCKMNILEALGITLCVDCSGDIPPDYESSVGGPPTNPISGASDITTNDSSGVLDAGGRAIGLQQLHPDSLRQTGETHNVFTGDHQPPLSSDSDTSVIMGVELDMSEVDIHGAGMERSQILSPTKPRLKCQEED